MPLAWHGRIPSGRIGTSIKIVACFFTGNDRSQTYRNSFYAKKAKRELITTSPFFVYVIPGESFPKGPKDSLPKGCPWHGRVLGTFGADRYYCSASWSPPVLTSSSYRRAELKQLLTKSHQPFFSTFPKNKRYDFLHTKIGKTRRFKPKWNVIWRQVIGVD